MIVSVNLVIRALPPASAAPVGGTGRRSLDEQGKPQEQKRRDEIHRRERIKGHPQGMLAIFRTEEVARHADERSEEHTSELQSLMRISYAVFCLKKKKNTKNNQN